MPNKRYLASSLFNLTLQKENVKYDQHVSNKHPYTQTTTPRFRTREEENPQFNQKLQLIMFIKVTLHVSS